MSRPKIGLHKKRPIRMVKRFSHNRGRYQTIIPDSKLNMRANTVQAGSEIHLLKWWRIRKMSEFL